MLEKISTVKEEIEIASLSSREIFISNPGRSKNILFLGYSLLPIRYSFKLFTDKKVLNEGISISHNTLPFLIQYKSTFDDDKIYLFLENLDEAKASKFNILVSFFD